MFSGDGDAGVGIRDMDIEAGPARQKPWRDVWHDVEGIASMESAQCERAWLPLLPLAPPRWLVQLGWGSAGAATWSVAGSRA